MARWLRQSTAVDIAIGPFLDSTDGVTAETGLTISQADVRLKKNNGSWAQVSDNTSATHEENGWYEKELDTTDTNTLGMLIIAVHESGALPVWHEFLVVPANVWDSYFSTDLLQVDAREWLGGTIATPTVTGVPEVDLTHIAGSANSTTTAQLGVNVVQISGDSGAADNAETAFDGGSYNVGGGGVVAASVTGLTNATIADAVWDEDATGHQTQGTFGQAIGDPAADANTIYAAVVTGAAGATVAADIVAIKAETASILSDTNAILVDTGTTLDGKLNTIDGIVDDILVDTAEIGAAGAGLTNINLPNQTMDIVGNITGNLSGSVGSVTGAVGSVTGNVGGTINGLTATALKDFFDTDSTTTYASAVAGSVVKEIADNAGGASLTLADIADAVWEEDLTDHSGTVGSVAEALGAAGSAGDPWTTALPGAYGAGTAGKIIGDNINATISSRASQASVDTVDDLLDTEVAAIFDRIGAPVGVSISADIAAVKTQTAAIETDTQDIQSRIPAALVSGRIDASVGAMAANVLTSSATAANYVTEMQSGLATSASITTLQTSVDDLPTNAELATALGTADDAVLAAIDALPTAAENADAVWDEVLAGHVGAGSTGEALGAAGAAGDPWITALPGAYGAGSAGSIIGGLTFTVAGKVDANITHVNDTEVAGAGTSGDPWGP